MGHGNSQLNLRRRDCIRPDLSPKYAPLCSSQVPCTSLLFGDDLVQSCKAIHETNKISSKVYGIDVSNRRRGIRGGSFRSSADYRYHNRQQRTPYSRGGWQNSRRHRYTKMEDSRRPTPAINRKNMQRRMLPSQ